MGKKQEKKNYKTNLEDIGDGRLLPERYIDLMMVTAIQAIPKALESEARDMAASLQAGMTTYCLMVDMLQRFSEAREMVDEEQFKIDLEKEIAKAKTELDAQEEDVKRCRIANLKMKVIAREIFPDSAKTAPLVM